MKRKGLSEFILVLWLGVIVCPGCDRPERPFSEYLKDLPGTYHITYGLNPSRTTYRGYVSIATSGEIYRLVWKIPETPAYEGVGMVVNNFLCVGWGKRGRDYGVAVYEVKGGSLKGKWVTADLNSAGTEDLEGSTGLSGIYTIVNSFSPRTGKGYAGTVAIAKSGQVYSVTWSRAGESCTGVGILRDNLLIVGWGVGVVYYQIRDGELLGQWATTEDTDIGVEHLSKVAF